MDAMEKVHMHNPVSGGALCGALRAQPSTTQEDAVTCPLCDALLRGRVIAHRLVEGVHDRLTAKLAELQREPGVRILTRFARSVLRADRESRAQRR